MRYSLILTDCSMPIKDGYEAAREIRKIFKSINNKPHRQLPPFDSPSPFVKSFEPSILQNMVDIGPGFPRIIAITGHVEPDYILKAIEKGIDRVFPKPLPVLELGF